MAMWIPFWRFNSLYNGKSITPKKKKTFRWNAKVLTFFSDLYIFSGFRTLIEHRNDFKFSEDFCMILLCKLIWLNPREISIMNLRFTNILSLRRSCHFFIVMGTKIIIPYSFFVCKTVGRVDVGHHFESFTVATTTWLTVLDYLWHKWLRICSTSRKHFPVLFSFMIYLSLLIKKTIAC